MLFVHTIYQFFLANRSMMEHDVGNKSWAPQTEGLGGGRLGPKGNRRRRHGARGRPQGRGGWGMGLEPEDKGK